MGSHVQSFMMSSHIFLGLPRILFTSKVPCNNTLYNAVLFGEVSIPQQPRFYSLRDRLVRGKCGNRACCVLDSLKSGEGYSRLRHHVAYVLLFGQNSI